MRRAREAKREYARVAPLVLIFSFGNVMLPVLGPELGPELGPLAPEELGPELAQGLRVAALAPKAAVRRLTWLWRS